MEIVKSSLLEATVKQMAELSDDQLEKMINPEETTNGVKSTTESTTTEEWMPIDINFYSGTNPTAPAPGALTEEEKRKRLIIVMSSLFAALILFIIIMAFKANK